MAIPITLKVLARLEACKSKYKEQPDLYDVKIYKPDGREGPTVRGLTYGQAYALVTGLKNCFVKSKVNLTK